MSSTNDSKFPPFIDNLTGKILSFILKKSDNLVVFVMNSNPRNNLWNSLYFTTVGTKNIKAFIDYFYQELISREKLFKTQSVKNYFDYEKKTQSILTKTIVVFENFNKTKQILQNDEDKDSYLKFIKIEKYGKQYGIMFPWSIPDLNLKNKDFRKINSTLKK